MTIRPTAKNNSNATAKALVGDGDRTLGLLGTAFTVEQTFYKGRLAKRLNLKVLVPGQGSRHIVHTIIYDEFCRGKILGAPRQRYLDIFSGLARAGAEAVILGRTKIGLLIKPEDTAVKLHDTTAIHAARAVAWALEGP
ncbi:MAG: aspartate/glutamate racemase family protein [Desulfobacteraceae bacterium]|jgi:aspartate racemase|nr:aspartate/glutamate racemase family protein [Desulfobacteraceae bacterium]